MRPNRRLALILVLFYAAFAVGVSLHSHAGKDPVSQDCKLCQASQVSLIQTPETHCVPGALMVGLADEATPAALFFEAAPILSGRAPPAA